MQQVELKVLAAVLQLLGFREDSLGLVAFGQRHAPLRQADLGLLCTMDHEALTSYMAGAALAQAS